MNFKNFKINKMKLDFADKQVRNKSLVPVYKMQIKLQVSAKNYFTLR